MSLAAEIAKILLDIKAVSLNSKEPFRYTSGLLSPIYCDNRLVISYPQQRRTIISAFLQLIKQQALQADIIAGTATAGIPHAAWIAEQLDKPMVYVRNKSKQHGKQNQIEGRVERNAQVLVVEDLISTGKSVIAASNALRTAHCQVTHCIAIFSYELTTTQQQLQAAQLHCHTLTNFSTLVEVAHQQGFIAANEVSAILAWQQNPQQWAKRMGFAS